MSTSSSVPFSIRILNFLSRRSFRTLYVISDMLYYLVHYVVRYRVKMVRKNLQLAFPEKSDKERRDIEKKFYRFFCDMAVEVVKGHSMSADEMRSHVEYVGLDLVEQSILNGRFAFCYLGHYGNWEWMSATNLHLTQGCKIAEIYHPLRNKAFDKWFLETRCHFGAINIPMKQTLRKVLEIQNALTAGTAPARGYLLGVVGDQLPKRENIHHRVDFLGQSTAVFTGSETMGKRINAAFYHSRITRPRRGHYCVEFVPMSLESKEVPDFEITDRYMQLFEADIRQQPELWLWTHDRWKR